MIVGILGHFGNGRKLLNGQTIKTQNLKDGLKKYSDVKVFEIDTYNWKSNPFSLVKKIIVALKMCDCIIMLPAQNGVKVFAPMIYFLNRRYHKKLFYDVIGAWLPSFLEKQKKLQSVLKKFDGIWVETSVLQRKMEKLGFININLVPNFKDIRRNPEVYKSFKKPRSICTFSRVIIEKGIEDIIDAVVKTNNHFGEIVYKLDIYGQVDKQEQEWFENLLKKIDSVSYVSYLGSVDSEKSVATLRKYFMLVFPTKFFTEGIPGTILDAYAAGIPVLASRWESFDDVVVDGKTGYGYEFNDTNQLYEKLVEINLNPELIDGLRDNCVNRFSYYETKNVIEQIVELMTW